MHSGAVSIFGLFYEFKWVANELGHDIIEIYGHPWWIALNKPWYNIYNLVLNYGVCSTNNCIEIDMKFYAACFDFENGNNQASGSRNECVTMS